MLGLRGERAGQYLMLFEIDSIEHRNQSSDGNKTELANQFWQEQPQKCMKSLPNRNIMVLLVKFQLFTLIINYWPKIKKSAVCYDPRYLEQPNQEPIDRVIGIHNLALQPGIKAVTFEIFIAENHHRIEDYPGWKFRLLKS
ncbi:MAG: hypothetical protein ACL7BU_00840 [Candidatus Phlomobacter fragariae]